MIRKGKQIITTLLMSFIALPIWAADKGPAMQVQIKIGFQNKTTCELSDFESDKNKVEGRSNIVHDENSISWTANCTIPLPKTVSYCLLSSHEVASPDAFISWHSGFQKTVIRAKIVSESDINPGFGVYSATYLCFE